MVSTDVAEGWQEDEPPTCAKYHLEKNDTSDVKKRRSFAEIRKPFEFS